MSIGENLEEVKELNAYVQENHPEKLLSRIVIYWNHWLNRAETNLGDLSDGAEDCSNRAC